MVANRGFNSLQSKTRLRLIEAAYDLLGTEGYLAISARRVAEHAGVKPQLVHYYFRSMEDLVIAVFKMSNATFFGRNDKALTSPNPLRRIWDLNCLAPESKRMMEYIALGRQYPRLRSAMREAGNNNRLRQIEAIEQIYGSIGREPPMPAPALAMLLSAAARNIMIEGSVGMDLGHEEIQVQIESWLDSITMSLEVEQP